MHAGVIGHPLFNGRRSRAVRSEAQRRERVLASARAVLAVGFAIYCEPASPSPYAALAYLVVLAYLVYSLLLLVFLRAKQDSSPAFRLSLHAVDTLWAALLCWFGGSPTSSLPFEDVFLVFALLAAAYRWGLRETLATSSVCIGFLVAGKALAITGISQLADIRHFDIRHLYIKRLSVSDLNWLVMQALAMVVTACLVGYLGEKGNQLRANTSAIARVVGKTHSESGLRETMQAVLGAMLDLFDSDRAVLATRQWYHRRAFLWEAERRRGREGITLQLSELDSFQHERYYFPLPGQIFYAARQPLSQGDRRFQLLFKGSQTDRLVKTSYSFPDYFLTWHPFSSVLGGSVVLGEPEEWCGRLFLFDPRVNSDREGELRFFHELVEEVGPAVYNVYRLRHLRSRAVSMERARIARELHDGVIQTLISTEMELAVLHRQPTSDPAYTAYELGRIQNHLRQEILNVRDLIRRIKPIDLVG